MGLTDQLVRLAPASDACQPSATSEQKASHFFRSTNKGNLRHGLFLSLELLLEGLDFPLVLGAELLLLLLPLRLGKFAGLRLQGEHWLLVGILGSLAPPFHLLKVQTAFSAIGAELSGIEPCGLEHHRELVGSTPALRLFSRIPAPPLPAIARPSSIYRV